MISRELKAASSKPMILSILAKGDSYGYQILQDILKISGGEWQWSEAMLYPVLHRLNSEGLIQSRWEIQENGRKRKYYGLTKTGKEALVLEKKHWLNMHNALVGLWDGLESSPSTS
ncbi:MAG: PadR family transcriptional regulator [Balneolaceae bacterium]